MRIGREFYNLLVRVVDPKDDLSSKRVTLISSLIYFFISSFIYTILGVIIVFVSGKGDIEQIKIFISLIRELIYYNFLIIVSAIGLITVVDMGRAVVDKAKATLPAITMQPGSEGTVIQNAETISPVDTVTAQNVQTVNTQTNINPSKEEKEPFPNAPMD